MVSHVQGKIITIMSEINDTHIRYKQIPKQMGINFDVGLQIEKWACSMY